MSLHRRAFLSSLAVATAGCVESGGDETRSPNTSTVPVATGTTSEAPTTSTVTPSDAFADGTAGPPDCPGEYDPVDPAYVVEGTGPLAGFDLLLSTARVTRGEAFTVELRNVTAETRTTGIRAKYDVQSLGDDGWHSVFGTASDVAFVDLAYAHEPGEGFRWDLVFSESGLAIEDDGSPGYVVCSSLDPGRYRFVYWGITTERERTENYETDYAIGAPFVVDQ